jgi:hypothetical protein
MLILPNFLTGSSLPLSRVNFPVEFYILAELTLNMRKFVLFFLGVSFLVSSCQKEINFDTPPGSGPGPGTGGNTNFGYQPVGKNSYWKYRQTGSFSGDITITSTGQKKTVNGIEYTMFSTIPVSPGAEQMLGTKDHNLYTLAQGNSPNTGAPFDLNMLYTNDTAPVGYTWEHTAGHGNGFTALTPGSILEKGISLTVAGKNFQNVIHSQISLQYELPLFGIVSFATYDYYVAKDVGIIRIETTGDPVMAPGVHSISDLIEYSIK